MRETQTTGQASGVTYALIALSLTPNRNGVLTMSNNNNKPAARAFVPSSDPYADAAAAFDDTDRLTLKGAAISRLEGSAETIAQGIAEARVRRAYPATAWKAEASGPQTYGDFVRLSARLPLFTDGVTKATVEKYRTATTITLAAHLDPSDPVIYAQAFAASRAGKGKAATKGAETIAALVTDADTRAIKFRVMVEALIGAAATARASREAAASKSKASKEAAEAEAQAFAQAHPLAALAGILAETINKADADTLAALAGILAAAETERAERAASLAVEGVTTA